MRATTRTTRDSDNYQPYGFVENFYLELKSLLGNCFSSSSWNPTNAYAEIMISKAKIWKRIIIFIRSVLCYTLLRDFTHYIIGFLNQIMTCMAWTRFKIAKCGMLLSREYFNFTKKKKINKTHENIFERILCKQIFCQLGNFE